MRREISAMILKHFFPNRFEKLQNIYNDLFPNTGIYATHKQDEDFYEQLLSMYQMTYMVWIWAFMSIWSGLWCVNLGLAQDT